MSSSSDCSVVRRPVRADDDPTQEGQERQEGQQSRRSSRYEIYGTATRPFGESYRRSLLQQHQHQQQQEQQDTDQDSPLDTDSVEDDMGCSTSRSTVVEEAVKGKFQPVEQKPANTNVKVNGVLLKTINNNTIKNYKGLSDFEIIYGTDSNKSTIDEGYSTTDIYSEVKKPEKVEKKSNNQAQETVDQTPREKLMQQIRDRKGEDKEEMNGYCSFATVEKTIVAEKESKNETIHNQANVEKSEKTENKSQSNKTVVSEPTSFVEEEYSYEPEKKEATSKLVVRSRSLINLDTQANYNGCTLNRPNKLKITTKPDGTIRYGLRQGGSESDLLDDDSPPLESEVRSNYVSSIRSAFDAAIESQVKESGGRAEAFDGLRQYFQDNKHGLRELLCNNNVVIIEPFRPDPPTSPSDKSDTSSQRTCRITGATIKSPNGEPKSFIPSNTLPRRTKCNRPTKQGFYHPIKKNKELIDAELPDPDKVKNAKELFEKIFKSRSSPETPKKSTPRSFFNTITSKMRITPEVKVVQEGKKKQPRLVLDHVTPLQRRWTDSGSLSSGVSSDLSYDHDDLYHHEDRILEEYSSDDDLEYIYPYDDTETHPVAPEVLQKIRACGTSVTYYGGRVIARSHGSPMTTTIMDEIRRGGAHEGLRRFEEDPASAPAPPLGVKFRLVKSHSCGSRLEIAGTEEEAPQRTATSPQQESIAEEETTTTAEPGPGEEASLEDEEDKAEADRYVTTSPTSATTAAPPVMTWAELKLKEARRLWHCAPEAVRAPPQDMEFETFEVLEDTQPHKPEKTETGRG